MRERAEAAPAAIVRSGSAGLWLDGAPDQSEGSVCLHSSRGANPPREPWPRSTPVAEGRTKPTLALSPAPCTPMAYSSGSTVGLAHPFSCNQGSLLTAGWQLQHQLWFQQLFPLQQFEWQICGCQLITAVEIHVFVYMLVSHFECVSLQTAKTHTQNEYDM